MYDEEMYGSYPPWITLINKKKKKKRDKIENLIKIIILIK
jgi:hypothetical protein